MTDEAPAAADPATARVLLVDDDPEFHALARRLLARALPDATLTVYDPALRGRPEPSFPWSMFDCVLLDYHLGEDETGLDWLSNLREVAAPPPVVLLTGAGDEYVAVRAVKLGADDYLRKQDLSGNRLGKVVRAAVERRRRRGPAGPASSANDDPSTSLPVRDPRPRVAGYRVHSLVGEGATSRVYLGERELDGRTVVLKILSARYGTDRQQIRRFIREAQLIARAESPYVVRIFDQDTTSEGGYIAMEFLPRGDLKQRMALGLTRTDALNCLRNIAWALDAIHGVGIVHRDLKPSNLMFRHDDSLVLADFGLSREMDVSTDLTAHGQVLGTPAYMSPEQCEGERADERSDLYSAGAIFHEMLTGQRMYDGDSVIAILYQHIGAPLPTLPASLARYQPLLHALVAKSPADRIRSGRELAEALDALEQPAAPDAEP